MICKRIWLVVLILLSGLNSNAHILTNNGMWTAVCTQTQKLLESVDQNLQRPWKIVSFFGFIAAVTWWEIQRLQKVEPLDESVITLVRNELKKIGMPYWQSISIFSQDSPGACVTAGQVYVGKDLIKLIKETGDAAGIARAVLHHEAAHLKHNDNLRLLCAQPAAFCAVYQGASYIIKSVPFRLLATFLVSNFLFLSALTRWQECRADEAVADDPQLLFGLLIYFEVLMRNEICKLKKQHPKENIRNVYFSLEPVIQIFDTHPSHQYRLKRLQERIAQHPNKHVLSPRALAHALDPDLIKKIADDNTQIDELDLGSYAAQFIDDKASVLETHIA